MDGEILRTNQPEIDKLDHVFIEEENEPELTKEQYIDILKERLNRRNILLDVIRRAYYHDIVVVKEEILSKESNEERLSSLPSIDLRDTIPLFAPSETYLRVHPCEKCGGVVELVHGETKELNEARQQCNRALKAEQNMKGIVHRLRGELKDVTEISEALQQRIRGLMKENKFTLEQLQVTRKAERDQKSSLADLKSKLQHATATKESVTKLTHQVKELNMELERENKQKSQAIAALEDLQDEFDQLKASYTSETNERNRLEKELKGLTKLYDECKKNEAYLSTEFALLSEKHKIQLEVDEILQTALSKVKEDLATLSNTSELTKRQLEDQLTSEEIAREELHEKYVDEKKRNKYMQRDMEAAQREAEEYEKQLNELMLKREMEQNTNQAKFDEELNLAKQTILRQMQQIEVLGMWENEWLSQLRARVCDQDDNDYDDESDEEETQMPTKETKIDPIPKEEDYESIILASAAAMKRSSVRKPSQLPAQGSTNVNPNDNSNDENPIPKLRRRESQRPQIVRKTQNGSDMVAMFKELEDARERSKQLKQRIHDQEKILQSSKSQIAELTMSNQVFQSSLQELILKASEANQSETQTITLLHEARDELEILMKEKDRSERRVIAFEGFLTQLGAELYYLVEDPTCLTPVAVPLVLDVPEETSISLKNGLTLEMMAKKQAIQQQLYQEQVLNNYIRAYSERIDIYCGNIKRTQEIMNELSHDLRASQRKNENQYNLLEQSATETASLKLELETERSNSIKLDRVVKITVAELNQVNEKMRGQKKMVDEVDIERNKLQEEKRKIAFMMIEKSKTLDREIDLNQQLTEKIKNLEIELNKMIEIKNEVSKELQVFINHQIYRKATNQEIGITVKPFTCDIGMQTDRWKPQGLVLRQRNNSNMLPQRYEGPSKVMIACPSLDTLLKENVLYQSDQRPMTSNNTIPSSNSEETRWIHTAEPRKGRKPINLPKV